MKKTLSLLCISTLLILALSGCSGMSSKETGTLVGAGVGGAAGAGIGAAVGGTTGAVIGGAAGAATGAYVGHEVAQ